MHFYFRFSVTQNQAKLRETELKNDPFMFSSEFMLFVRARGHEYSKLKVLFGSKLMQRSPKWAQNWPFCFFKKISPIPFSCFWHEVGKLGLLENPVYLLVFVWSSQLPSQIWLEKILISDFLHDVRELFKTIWNYDYSNVLNIFFVESFCPKSGQIRPEDDLLDPCKSWRNRKS